MRLPAAEHRRLHQFWHDPNPPDWVEALSQEWQFFHPGWHYHRFDVHEAIAFMRAEFEPDIHAAFCDIRLPSMVADVFRLALVLKQGGVYVDMATRWYAPLEDWLNLREGLVVLRRPPPPRALRGLERVHRHRWPWPSLHRRCLGDRGQPHCAQGRGQRGPHHRTKSAANAFRALPCVVSPLCG
jgi:hypothetical protein